VGRHESSVEHPSGSTGVSHGPVWFAGLAAVVSAVVPGAGHLLAGRVRRALPFLAFSALTAFAVVSAVRMDHSHLLALLVDPAWLTGAVAATAVSLLVRTVAALDAYRCVRPWLARPLVPSLAGLVVLGVVGVALVPPHLVLARDALAQDRLVGQVFADDQTGPVEPGPLPSAAARPAPSGYSHPTPSPSPTHTQPAGWPALGTDGRYTVLLLGSDAGPSRVGARTDTMVLLSIDPRTRSAVMIGIPRNLEKIPFPPGPMQQRFPAGFDDLANAVYGYGTAHRDLFPHAKDPGATAIEEAVAAATGLEIDDWAMVDLDGVVGVVRALGGLTLDVPKEVADRVSPYVDGGPWISADIKAGRQHLTADQAYVYVRSRHADSDYQRMARQRCVLGAIGTQLTGSRLIATYPDLAAAVRRNVTTDIPRSRLPQLIALGSSLRLSNVRTLLLVPPVVDPRSPDYGAIRALVRAALAGHLPASSVASASVLTACD
jgi:polyisoprenyl-teichoic acid--peptidoglycan teichoic acid transferase